MRSFLLLSISAVVFLSQAAWGQSEQDSSLVKDGDRVLFVGDSITEQRIYTRNVMDYFALRQPGMLLHFRNRGISGSTANFDEAFFAKTMALKPTVATICFGMNDGGYKPYDETTFRRYMDNMTHWVQAFKKENVRVFLLTPGCVDEDRKPDVKGFYNETLGKLAQGAQDLAKRENVPVFDLHTLMMDVQTKAKAADPKFTMIPDGVHPSPAGHVLMTYAVLKVLDCRRQASAVEIDAAKPSAACQRCKVSDLEVADGNIRFVRLDEALPAWFEDPNSTVFKLCPFTEDFNRYILKVTGLKAGQWKLTVEKKVIGIFGDQYLAAGVNLAMLPGPWRDLGARVHQLGEDNDNLYYLAWRGLSPIRFPKDISKDIEPQRQALVDKLLDCLEQNDTLRCQLSPADRTWSWSLTREP